MGERRGRGGGLGSQGEGWQAQACPGLQRPGDQLHGNAEGRKQRAGEVRAQGETTKRMKGQEHGHAERRMEAFLRPQQSQHSK